MVVHHCPRHGAGLGGEFGTRLDSGLIDGLNTRLGLVMVFFVFLLDFHRRACTASIMDNRDFFPSCHAYIYIH